MIRQQRWVPDTCASPATGDACVWLEEWDDSVDVAARTHTLVSREKACSFHALETPASGFARCYDENKRKNITWSAALVEKASLTLDKYQWSYSDTGVLTVNFGSDLTAQQKTRLQNACNIQFGPGKVIVL